MAKNPPAKKPRPNPRAEARKVAQRRQRIILVIAGISALALAVGIAVLSVLIEGNDQAGQPLDEVAGDIEVAGDAVEGRVVARSSGILAPGVLDQLVAELAAS